MAKSIKRNFIYNIILNTSKVIFPLITAPYISRVLEPDGVGLFNFANTYVNYFALVAALGIPLYGIREVAKIEDDRDAQTRFVSEIISISIIATILCSIVFFITLLYIPMLNANYVVFIVAAAVLYSTPFRIDWYFSGKEEFGYIALRSLIIKTLSIILLFAFVREKDDLLLYVALNAGCLVLNEVWNYIKLYKSGIHPYFTLSGTKHVKSLFILFSSSIAISVYAILDTLMLGFMTDYSEVGYYNCATHISKAFIPVVTSLAAVALPRITQLMEQRRWEEINVLMNKSFSIVAFLSIPIAFGTIAIAPTFVPWFFGDQFYGTIYPLQIIILTVIIIGFNNLTGVQILLGFGFDKLFLYSIISGAIINFIFNLMLIPVLGATGAAISSVLAETVILVVMLWLIYMHTNVRFSSSMETIMTLLISLSFFPTCYYINRLFTGTLDIAVSISACSFIYFFFQYISNNTSMLTITKLIKDKLNHQV